MKYVSTLALRNHLSSTFMLYALSVYKKNYSAGFSVARVRYFFFLRVAAKNCHNRFKLLWYG